MLGVAHIMKYIIWTYEYLHNTVTSGTHMMLVSRTLEIGQNYQNIYHILGTNFELPIYVIWECKFAHLN